MKNVKKSPEERKKFLDEMIKWRRKGAIVGGIWGLISGVWYGWNSLVTGFSPYDMLSSMFDSFLEIIIFFPTFVTEMKLLIKKKTVNKLWLQKQKF